MGKLKTYQEQLQDIVEKGINAAEEQQKKLAAKPFEYAEKLESEAREYSVKSLRKRYDSYAESLFEQLRSLNSRLRQLRGRAGGQAGEGSGGRRGCGFRGGRGSGRSRRRSEEIRDREEAGGPQGTGPQAGCHGQEKLYGLGLIRAAAQKGVADGQRLFSCEMR